MRARYIPVALFIVPVGLSFSLQHHGRRALVTLETFHQGELPRVSLSKTAQWTFDLVEKGLLPLPFLVVVAIGIITFFYQLKSKNAYSILAVSLTWLVLFIMSYALILAFSFPFLLPIVIHD